MTCSTCLTLAIWVIGGLISPWMLWGNGVVSKKFSEVYSYRLITFSLLVVSDSDWKVLFQVGWVGLGQVRWGWYLLRLIPTQPNLSFPLAELGYTELFLRSVLGQGRHNDIHNEDLAQIGEDIYKKWYYYEACYRYLW